LLPGSKNTFSVKVPKNEIVNELKKEIWREQSLTSVLARDLNLHRVQIAKHLNNDKGMRMAELRRLHDLLGEENLGNCVAAAVLMWKVRIFTATSA
jgi:hypothetical protein